MTEARPNMLPSTEAYAAGAEAGAPAMPSLDPPAAVRAAAAVSDQVTTPEPPTAGMGEGAPGLPLVEGGVAADIGAWLNNKRVNGLWSINQNRNSWAGIQGIGWKKLSNKSDSAIVALTMLAAHAREKNSVVNYRDESDGMIHEIYVW